ncbi:MAG TPA: hypothetical protein VEX38_07130 [Fimbriimonadaceae bacterium]|nr:hypothetical protein [Fimbriimonadaceae bacterium]
MHLLPLLFCAYALALQEPAAPDRTGEPELRRILEAHGKLRNVQIVIGKSARERSDQVMQPDKTLTLWYAGPNRFRMAASSYWGDAALYVSDGKTLYSDPLDDSQPAILRNTTVTPIPMVHNDLSLRGGNGSMLFYLLEGAGAFDKIVDSGGNITLKESAVERQVTFKSKDFGTVSIFVDKAKRLAHRIEYDNLPGKLAAYLRFPMWMEKPEDPLDREEITITPMRSFPRDTFSVKPPKWRPVTDQRKKPPA